MIKHLTARDVLDCLVFKSNAKLSIHTDENSGIVITDLNDGVTLTLTKLELDNNIYTKNDITSLPTTRHNLLIWHKLLRYAHFDLSRLCSKFMYNQNSDGLDGHLFSETISIKVSEDCIRDSNGDIIIFVVRDINNLDGDIILTDNSFAGIADSELNLLLHMLHKFSKEFDNFITKLPKKISSFKLIDYVGSKKLNVLASVNAAANGWYPELRCRYYVDGDIAEFMLDRKFSVLHNKTNYAALRIVMAVELSQLGTYPKLNYMQVSRILAFIFLSKYMNAITAQGLDDE